MSTMYELPVSTSTDIEDLWPRARALAVLTGRIPSIRSLKRELHIGEPKARELHRRLVAEGPDVPLSPVDFAPAAVAAELVDDLDELAAPVIVEQAPAAVAEPRRHRPPRSWPVWLLAMPAFVAVWSGWVGLGALTGFGIVHPLPGIADHFTINSAITLPIGVETLGAYAIRIWMSPAVTARTRRLARWITVLALTLGALGQVAYHLMAAAGMVRAPWPVTIAVGALPVLVLFAGAALAHLVHTDRGQR